MTTRAPISAGAPDDQDLVDSATLEAGIDEALALALDQTLDAGELGLRATLRPRTLAATPQRTERLFGGDGTTAPWHALPRLTWSAGGEGAEPAGPDAGHSAGTDLQVRSRLGEGGMGVVFLAEQRSLRRDVALKTVREAVDGPQNREALWREAVVMGQLDHPNIVPVHVLGADAKGRPALVMKRIEGWSWQQLADDPQHPLIASSDVPSLELHLEIAAKVADALAFAHDRGLVHRDVKPENVMVGRYGEVYLSDWGIAVELAQGASEADEPVAVAGTPAFMAPEMLIGRRGALGPTTDVFLLGASLHAVLTGRARHGGGDLRAMLRAVATTAPVAYGDTLPADVAALLNHATAASPEARPRSAAAMRAELRELLRLRSLAPTLAAAHERLASYDALLAEADRAATGELGAGPDAGPDADAEARNARLLRLLTEAQFGFAQVLAADAHSQAATTGQMQTLQRLARLELRVGNLARARAALAELEALAPAAADVSTLRRAVDEEAERQRALAAEREALHSIGRAHDPNAGRRARLYFVIPLLLVGLSLFVFLTFLRPLRTIDEAVQIGWVNFSVIVLATVLSWRRAVTAINRDLLVASLAAIGGVLLHRLFAVHDLDATLPQVLRNDALIIASVAATIRAPFRLGAILGAGTMLASALAIQARPGDAAMVFTVGISLMLLVFGIPMIAASRGGD